MSTIFSRRRVSALSCLIALMLSSCRQADSPETVLEPDMPPWFQEISQATGLDFRHDAGPLPAGRYFLPQVVGSGAALLDYDNDGRLDIYLVQNAPKSPSRNRLFHQEYDGRFTDVSAGSGLDVVGYGMGVAAGDVDNDGLPDVLLTEYGGIRLFHNQGNGRFADITRSAGLDNPQWGTSACMVDYDRDGWLDLVIVNYVEYDPTKVCSHGGGAPDYCHPRNFTGSVTRLYRNRGSASPSFADVTLASGLGQAPGPGLGVLAADFDGDGWPDILVANDSQPNHLWINQRDGTFKEEAPQRGLAYNVLGQPQANMGIACGDVDGSGRFAVFITHLTEETNTLWKQQPRGLFRDDTAEAGLAASRWRGTGFGTVLADFDNDGALDLAVANGRVARSLAPTLPSPKLGEGNKIPSPMLGEGRVGDASAQEAGPFWSRYAERNQLFAGDGKGSFRDLSPRQPALCGRAAVSRALAVGDLDNDGGLDLLATTVAGPARLYRNVVPSRGHWLILRAIDSQRKRDAYGAEITVFAGGRRRRSWINPGFSFLCSNDPRAHFGLGPSENVEAIEVLWPDGVRERFAGRQGDRVVVLRKGEGKKP